MINKRDLGTEILEGISEIKQYNSGQVKLRTHELSEPSEPQVIRAKLRLSQSAFAGLLHCHGDYRFYGWHGMGAASGNIESTIPAQ